MSGIENPQNSKFFIPLVNEVARGVNVKDAAVAIGLSEDHAYDLSRTPQFKQHVSQVQTSMIERTVARLVEASELAVQTLEDCLPETERDPKWIATAKVRITSAKALLGSLLPLSDYFDMRRRLEVLEKRMTDEEGG